MQAVKFDTCRADGISLNFDAEKKTVGVSENPMTGKTLSLDHVSITQDFFTLSKNDPCHDPHSLQKEVAATIRPALSQSAINDLRGLRDGRFPYVLIQTGFNLDGLPETPTGLPPISDFGWQQMAWLTVGLMELAEIRLISYEMENSGAAFVNLVTLPPSDSDKRNAEKSQMGMRGHTDGVSLPLPSEFNGGDCSNSPSPDFLVLVGLRNPDKIATRLAIVSDILTNLSDDEEAALAEPYFHIQPQRTFENCKDRTFAPLLSTNEPNGLSMRFSHSNVVAAVESPEIAQKALDRFQNELQSAYREVPIMPGEICILNNRNVIHGRNAPGGAFGGQSRWLLRTYGWRASTHGIPSMLASHIQR